MTLLPDNGSSASSSVRSFEDTPGFSAATDSRAPGAPNCRIATGVDRARVVATFLRGKPTVLDGKLA